MPKELVDDRLMIDLMIESTGGGSMRHVMDLFSTLEAHGHDVRLIASMTRAEPSVIKWIEEISPKRIIRADTPRAPHISDLGLLRRLRKRLSSDGRNRILHAHSTKAGILASMLRTHTAATILTPHAYRGMDPGLHSLSRHTIRSAERMFSRRMDHIIAVSPEEEKYTSQLGISASKISYIPNGIDIHAIRNKAESSRPPKPRGVPIAGFVGRMTKQKNPILFLETCAILHKSVPNFRAIMIGDGDMMGEVMERRTELKLDDVVELAGAIDFPSQMHRMDIMIHTSLYESLPYVLLEAGAAGLAVVAVRNSGSEAIWPNARLSPHDPATLAEMTIPLLISENALAISRAASTSGASRFSIEAMVRQTENVYRDILHTVQNKFV